MTTELKCTEYITYEGNDVDWRPCNCPACGGWLRWEKDTPKCTKCGAELLAIPDRNEDTGEVMNYGKICPISERKK